MTDSTQNNDPVDAVKAEELRYAPKDLQEAIKGNEAGGAELSADATQDVLEPEGNESTQPLEESKQEAIEDNVTREFIERPAPKAEARSSATANIIWTGALVVMLGIVLYMSYMFYGQLEQLPNDPIDEAKAENEKFKLAWHEAKDKHLEAEKIAIHNEYLINQFRQLRELNESIQLKLKKIADIEKELLSLRTQMKAYYKEYTIFAREAARKNLTLESMQTVKSKETFIDVRFQRITDAGVILEHAGGVKSIKADELPPAVRELLCYEDVMGLADMEQEALLLKQELETIEKSSIVPESFKYQQYKEATKPQTATSQTMRTDYDSPIRGPLVSTKTLSEAMRQRDEAEKNRGMMPVHTRPAETLDGLLPPPSGE